MHIYINVLVKCTRINIILNDYYCSYHSQVQLLVDKYSIVYASNLCNL